MDDKQMEAMKKKFIASMSEVADKFNPADLPPDEAWKNDLNAIADGLFSGKKPKGLEDINPVMRYMMVKSMEAEMASENMLEKEGTVDMVFPETLMDLITQSAGLTDAVGGFDPSKLNFVPKKDVN